MNESDEIKKRILDRLKSKTYYKIYCDRCGKFLCSVANPRKLVCFDCWLASPRKPRLTT